MWKPYSRSNSRSDSRNWLDAKVSAQILGAFFSKLGWLPRKYEKIRRKIGKMAPNPIFSHFWAIFPIFRLIFSYFLGEAETFFFPIFFLFRAGGPKWGLYQANRIPRLGFSRHAKRPLIWDDDVGPLLTIAFIKDLWHAILPTRYREEWLFSLQCAGDICRNQRPPKGARKMVPCAKSVEKCRKTFWHFLTIFDVFLPCAKIVEKCRKTFWRFLTFFDVAPFRRPLLQSADARSRKSALTD